jgi:3-oxoacyl-(acyl-carrier-protein) synthase
MNNNLAITSMGISHNLGLSIEDFETNAISCIQKQSILMIDDKFLTETISAKLSEDFLRRMNRLSLIALNAFYDCFDKIKSHREEPDYGIILSTTYGAASSCKDFIESAIDKGVSKASPLLFPYTVSNAITGILSIFSQYKGFNTTISGYNPICYSDIVLQQSKADLLIVGGVDELLEDVKTAKINNLNGNGCISEGAAFIAITKKQFAQENKLPTLCNIYSTSSKLNDITNSNIDNTGHISSSMITWVMEDAIRKAELDRKNINAIIGLSQNDEQKKAELDAIQKVFGYNNIPEIVWIKDIIGETFGASDTFAVIYGYITLKNKSYCGCIMVNSYLIGGSISSAIISK